VGHRGAGTRHGSARVSTQLPCAVELPVPTLVVLVDGADAVAETIKKSELRMR